MGVFNMKWLGLVGELGEIPIWVSGWGLHMRWRRLRGEVGLGSEIQENPDKTWMIASFMEPI